MEAFIEAATWQGLASVIIPGFTINRICASSRFLLSRYSRVSPGVRGWAATLIGLAAIPVIIKPIDRSVTGYIIFTIRLPCDNRLHCDNRLNPSLCPVIAGYIVIIGYIHQSVL